MQPTIPMQPQPQRLPRPGWPFWVLFVLVLLPGVVMLGILGGVKDASAEVVAGQVDAVGRNVVVTGTLTDVETSSGLPKTSGIYSVVVPASDGRAEETITAYGDEYWGFPPSSDHPAELSFLVVLDDPPRAVQHGPVGSVQPVTEESLQSAEGGLAFAEALWVTSIVVYWLLVLGLPVVAFTLSRRRRRAKIDRWRAASESASPPATVHPTYPVSGQLPPPRI
ncbi:hypothetical protein ACEXQD_16315 [Herbiconiux sp. P15]|uniref:hypothetical protein n=1 Tax=Herbiconiux liukaitaii TaxID=3342799 RepID=UPI0035BAF222